MCLLGGHAGAGHDHPGPFSGRAGSSIVPQIPQSMGSSMVVKKWGRDRSDDDESQ